MTRNIPSAPVVAMAVLALLITAVLANFLFGALAKPRAYKPRMTALAASVDALGQPGARAARGGYGPGAVCNGAVLAASQTLRQSLEDQARTVGASLKGLSVSPVQSGDKLIPIEVSFTAEGPYGSAVQLMALLETAQPEVFVDAADLRPTANGASLHVTGRAFCWPSARP